MNVETMMWVQTVIAWAVALGIIGFIIWIVIMVMKHFGVVG